MEVSRALKIHSKDNCAVALTGIPADAGVTVRTDNGDLRVTSREQIPFAHKIAIDAIPEGGEILKYGVPIAIATRPIAAGEWIHLHNSSSRFAPQGKEKTL